MKFSVLMLAVVSTFSLVGCGGGGGGSGGGSSPTLSAFTSWSNVEAGQRVRLSGDSQEASYTASLNNDEIRVESISNISAHQSGAELIGGSDSNGDLNYVRLTTAAGTVLEFSRSNGANFDFDPNGIGLISNRDGSDYIVYVDPYIAEFEYQTFGIWTTGGETGSGKVGEFSVGNATPVSNMPISGTARYVGFSTGRYVNENNISFFSVSALGMDADFASGTIDFRTSDTQIINERTGNASDLESLNMGGTLNILSNSNQFTGSVTTRTAATAGRLDGSVSGRFYGPTANEVGGTFQLQNSSGEFHSGSFGGAQGVR